MELKLLEAYSRDDGRGVARIDYDTMDKLNVGTGEFILVKGKIESIFKILPLYPSDENKHIIRLDAVGRKNIRSELPDIIEVIKGIKSNELIRGENIEVKPLHAIPPIDERYLADALESVAVGVGDEVIVPYFGKRLSFLIQKISPDKGGVVITQKTIFKILGESDPEPKPEIKILDIICKVCEKSFKEHSNTQAKLCFSILELYKNQRGKL